MSSPKDQIGAASQQDDSKDFSKAISDLGDKLYSSFTTASTKTEAMLQSQIDNFQTMQDLHTDRTDKILRSLQSSGGGVTAGKRKDTEPPVLNEVDPIKWTSFKKCFKTVAKINNWEDSYSIQRLSTCIRDQAARAIDHLTLTDSTTLEDAYKAIEEVYINPAGKEFFKAAFRLATREAHESFLQWHTRCRELFLRAYPDTAGLDTNDELKERFILGLRDRNLAANIKTSDSYDKWTYTDLLNRAQRVYGNTLIVHSAYSNKPLPSENISSIELSDIDGTPRPGDPATVQSLGTRQNYNSRANSYNNIKCHRCGRLGHIASNCYARRQEEPPKEVTSKKNPYSNQGQGQFSRNNQQRRSMRRNGRGRGNGNRYRGRTSNTTSAHPRFISKQVNAMGNEEPQENEEHQEDNQDPYELLKDSVNQSENY